MNQVWKGLNISWGNWTGKPMITTDDLQYWLNNYQYFLGELGSFVRQNENTTFERQIYDQIANINPGFNTSGLTLESLLTQHFQFFGNFSNWFN